MAYLIDYGSLPPGAQPAGNLADPAVVPQLVAEHIISSTNTYRQGLKLTSVLISAQDLTNAISEVTVETQILGASLLQITLIDPNWVVQRSGLCDAGPDGLLPRMDVNYPHGTDVWWRLAMVDGGDDYSQANLTLTFQHRPISYLMSEWGPLQFSQLPGPHNTRAQFIKQLCDRIPGSLPAAVLGPGTATSQQIQFVCPQINELQPIASLSSTGTTVVVDSPASPSNKGTSTASKPSTSSTKHTVMVGHDVSNAFTRANKLPAAAKLSNTKGIVPDAVTFILRLANDTGLNAGVIAGWVVAETSGWNTTNGPNNWLNVGSFDSGFAGGGANVWLNPTTAADATAAFLEGKSVNGVAPPLGGGSSSIRAIMSTVGQSPTAQVNAIQNSDWATSHYGHALMITVQPYLAGATGGSLGGNSAGATTTNPTSTNTGSDIGQLQRGQPNNPDEDSWTCMQRLASEVNWMAFSCPHPAPGVWGNFLYFIDGPTLVAQEPGLYLRLSDDGTQFTGQASDGTTVEAGLVTNLKYTFDNTSFLMQQTRTVNGKTQRKTRIRTPQTPTQVKLNIINPEGPFQFCAGDVFVFQNAGPLSGNIPNAFGLAAKQIASNTTSGGRWIVEDVTHNTLGDVFAQYTLGPPTYPYPEPSATVGTTSKTSTVPGPNVPSNSSVPANTQGYVNPFASAKNLSPERVDMGVDFNATAGSPILAIGDAKIINASAGGTGWTSPLDTQACVYYQLTSGPQSGKYVYVGEDIKPTVSAGQTVKAGATIATFLHSTTGLETGWGSGTPYGSLAASLNQQAPGPDPGAWISAAGASFERFLVSLGCPKAPNYGGPEHGTNPAGYP